MIKEARKLTLDAFLMNGEMFSAIVGQIPEDKGKTKLHKTTSEFRRIALHLLVSRNTLGSLLEMDVPQLPWENLGEGTNAGFLLESTPPPLTEILKYWEMLLSIFKQLLLTVPDELLNQPNQFPLPGNPEATLQDFVSLSVIHESYHIGQMGMIMKAVTGISLQQLLMPEVNA